MDFFSIWLMETKCIVFVILSISVMNRFGPTRLDPARLSPTQPDPARPDTDALWRVISQSFKKYANCKLWHNLETCFKSILLYFRLKLFICFEAIAFHIKPGFCNFFMFFFANNSRTTGYFPNLIISCETKSQSLSESVYFFIQFKPECHFPTKI